MELARADVEVRGSKALKLFPIGDIHLGANACDINSFRRTVELVRSDPNARWIGMGDYADCILPSDPRWNVRSVDWSTIGRDSQGKLDVGDLAQHQINLVDREFGPIWSKCLGLLTGNHEQALQKHYFASLTERLAEKHNVPYLGQTALLKLDVTDGLKHTFSPVTFLEHGATGGGTEGNSLNNLLQRLSQFNADIYFKGHVHKRLMGRKPELAWGPSKLVQRVRVAALTGCYLKSYKEGETTYGEKAAYAPGEIGGVCALVHPRSKLIDIVNVEALSIL